MADLSVAELYALYERDLETAEERVEDARTVLEEGRERAGLESFASRFTGTRVSLLDLSPDDLLPPETLAGSNGVIIKGARHLWPMERKGGKSLATLVTAVDVVLGGGKVVILDRENGYRRYGLRLKDVVTAREYGGAELDAIRRGLGYYNFPQIRRGDRREFVAELGTADLVVFDSSRAFLSSLGLKEDSSDEYAAFMTGVIDPLFEQGVATLILDNTGHSDKSRSRGTSSKGDLNEQLFTSEKSHDFDRDTTGEITLEVEASRDGVPGRWTMALGGGVYGSWVASEGPAVNRKGGGKGAKKSGEKAERKEQMRVLLDEDPGMTNAALASALGVTVKTVTGYKGELMAEAAPFVATG